MRGTRAEPDLDRPLRLTVGKNFQRLDPCRLVPFMSRLAGDMIKSAREKTSLARRLAPAVQALLKWRDANKLSQQQAVHVMKARGFPMTLSTLKKWETGHLAIGKYAMLALEKFLSEHATITDAPIYARTASIGRLIGSLRSGRCALKG